MDKKALSELIEKTRKNLEEKQNSDSKPEQKSKPDQESEEDSDEELPEQNIPVEGNTVQELQEKIRQQEEELKRMNQNETVEEPPIKQTPSKPVSVSSPPSPNPDQEEIKLSVFESTAIFREALISQLVKISDSLSKLEEAVRQILK